MKEQLQQQLNLMINNNENKKVITVEELEKQIESFLAKYNNEIETIVIQEILHQDLRNEDNKLKIDKQKQINEEDRIKNIKQDIERLKIEKENFVKYNLILKERLFNECSNQFDRKLSEIIINEGNAIRDNLHNNPLYIII